MLTALYGQLSRNPCIRLKDMAAFLRNELDADVTRFSISRALREAKWSKKCTPNVARERNADLRDEYMHEMSFLRADQLVFIDETGVDRSIGIKRKGWAPRESGPARPSAFTEAGGSRSSRLILKTALYISGYMKGRLMRRCLSASLKHFCRIAASGLSPMSVLVMDNASFTTQRECSRCVTMQALYCFTCHPTRPT